MPLVKGLKAGFVKSGNDVRKIRAGETYEFTAATADKSVDEGLCVMINRGGQVLTATKQAEPVAVEETVEVDEKPAEKAEAKKPNKKKGKGKTAEPAADSGDENEVGAEAE